MKIKKALWMTGVHGCIGVVLMTNDVGENKAYIGRGLGDDEDKDAKNIALTGNKISPEIAEEIFNHLHG